MYDFFLKPSINQTLILMILNMKTIKVKFRNSSVPGKKGSVYYQICINRQVRHITTGYRLLPEEWDSDTRTVRIPPYTDKARRIFLESVSRQINLDIRRLHSIAVQFEGNLTDYTSEDIITASKSRPASPLLRLFMQEIIAEKLASGKFRTAETYTAALNSFMDYTDDRDVFMADLSPELIMKYEWFLKNKGVTRNTSSFYMRILRAAYNRAADLSIVPQKNPFRNVYTGVDKTVKRAVTLTEIRKIKELDLRGREKLEFARDIFLFSFYTRGMSFIDICFLKKKNLSHGILSYIRKKTGKLITIRWEDCMQKIADRHSDPDSPYLIGIIRKPHFREREQYKYASLETNKYLKEIGAMARLDIPLTMYVARHSWASIARSKNIPLPIISECMGHDNELTTRIYLASLDSTMVDRANSLILKSL